MQARRGELVDVLDGAGAIAEADGRGVGLITWAVPAGADPTGAEVRALAVDEAVRGARRRASAPCRRRGGASRGRQPEGVARDHE